MIRSDFNHETGILYTKFEGEILVDDIVAYVIQNNTNKSYPKVLRILTDATRAKLLLEYEGLERIAKEIETSNEIFRLVMDAFVIDKPRDTAISMIYKDLPDYPRYLFEIFSTFEAAINWLNTYDDYLLRTK